jgi:hypothetical protein
MDGHSHDTVPLHECADTALQIRGASSEPSCSPLAHSGPGGNQLDLLPFNPTTCRGYVGLLRHLFQSSLKNLSRLTETLVSTELN